jgi:hypothetical protein
MEKKEATEKIISQKIKGISTIIGCIISNIIIGNSLIWLYLPEKADYYFENKLKTKKVIISLILTFSNMTKLFFSFYTKYNNIRIYIFISFLLIILSQSLLYMFYIKSISYISFILYGIGVGFPFHQLVINSSLHFINKKPLILLINKISFNISPVLYYFYFSNTKTISPDGSEIIIFYLILSIISISLSFDYLRECRSVKNEPNEQALLIKNELEYSITDITNNTDRISDNSENSTNLNKREKNLIPGENDNVTGVFKSKRQSIISVLKEKNIYLIILYFSCAMFLAVEKIHKINNDDIGLFFISLFISYTIISYILSKYELPSIILRLAPFLVHSLIIIFHTFNSKKAEYSNQIEIIIVSISYSLQYSVIHPLLKKIYGEKNAVFFTDFVINFASSSRWIVVFFDFIRNSVRILTLVLMIILLLFINTKTFDFNSDRSKNLGIELKDKSVEEENDSNKEEENEIEDPLAIVDVKSDVE